MALPDFLVIGAPKAGTTALHAALAGHPQLFMSSVKEPKFFLCDGPPPRKGGPGDARTYRKYVWRREDYEALFADAPAGALRGESTPFYLVDGAAQHRIRAAIPEAKLIAVLRDPVERAHSNWTHLYSAGLEPVGDFAAACELEARRAEAGWAWFWRYLTLGRYGEQLAHLYTLFPREQVLILRYRELLHEPRAALNRVCAFLGVAPDIVVDVPWENVSTYVAPTLRNRALQALLYRGPAMARVLPTAARDAVSRPLLSALQRDGQPRPVLEAAERQRLAAYFAPDIALLERETGLPFADWLHHAYDRERA